MTISDGLKESFHAHALWLTESDVYTLNQIRVKKSMTMHEIINYFFELHFKFGDDNRSRTTELSIV